MRDGRRHSPDSALLLFVGSLPSTALIAQALNCAHLTRKGGTPREDGTVIEQRRAQGRHSGPQSAGCFACRGLPCRSAATGRLHRGGCFLRYFRFRHYGDAAERTREDEWSQLRHFLLSASPTAASSSGTCRCPCRYWRGSTAQSAYVAAAGCENGYRRIPAGFE